MSESSRRPSAADLVVRAPVVLPTHVRAAVCAAVRRVTSPRLVILASLHRQLGSLRADTGDAGRAPSRERVVAPTERRRSRRACAGRTVDARARRRVRRRASCDITAPLTAPHYSLLVTSPARLSQSRHRRRRASAEPRARRRCDRAPPTSSIVRRSRPSRRPPSQPVTTQSSMQDATAHRASARYRAGSLEPTRRLRASAAPRARRCCDRAPPTSSCVRRSRRRKTRGLVTPPNSVDATAPCGRSAALPATAPALLSRHGDGERAPRREHVVAATERRRPRRACAGLVVGKRGVS